MVCKWFTFISILTLFCMFIFFQLYVTFLYTVFLLHRQDVLSIYLILRKPESPYVHRVCWMYDMYIYIYINIEKYSIHTLVTENRVFAASPPSLISASECLHKLATTFSLKRAMGIVAFIVAATTLFVTTQKTSNGLSLLRREQWEHRSSIRPYCHARLSRILGHTRTRWSFRRSYIRIYRRYEETRLALHRQFFSERATRSNEWAASSRTSAVARKLFSELAARKQRDRLFHCACDFLHLSTLRYFSRLFTITLPSAASLPRRE